MLDLPHAAAADAADAADQRFFLRTIHVFVLRVSDFPSQPLPASALLGTNIQPKDWQTIGPLSALAWGCASAEALLARSK